MKKYIEFISESNEEKIHEICEDLYIKNYVINNDGSIDVDGDVHISGILDPEMTKLPLKFNRVNGDFDCSNNSLETLEGAPAFVDGDFDCSHNYIETLEGGIKEVKGVFDCSFNLLENLEGGPESVVAYNCRENDITSLKGCPKTIEGYFSCVGNKLKSLEGGPVEVAFNFECQENELISLVGGPVKVGKHFMCSYNELETLEGSPKKIGGNLQASNNNIVSIKECPNDISGWVISLHDNDIKSLEGFPLTINPARTEISIRNNPVEEVYSLLLGHSNSPDDKMRVIEEMNEVFPIYVDEMEVSYTILCDIWESNNETPIPFESIELKHYTLVT